jgi:hypothetical protein
MPFDIGGPQFGLRDGKIGTWDGDGTYTGLQDIFSIQLLGARAEVESQDLKGDDGITATAARTNKGTVTLRMGGIDIDALGYFLPGTDASSGVGSAMKKVMKVSNKKAPYVGLCGQAIAEEGDGDTHLFIPKCKISGPFEIKFEGDTFAIPEIQLTAVLDENFLDADGNPSLFHIVEHATATAVALPPVASL